MCKFTTLTLMTTALALGLASSSDAQVSVNLGNPYNGGWTVGNSGGQWYATPTYANPYNQYGNGAGYNNNPYAYNNGYGYNGYNRVYNNGTGWNASNGLTATQYHSGYAGYTQPSTTTYNYNYGATRGGYASPYSYSYRYPGTNTYGWSNGYTGGYGRYAGRRW